MQIDIAAIRAGAVIKEDLFDIANDLLQNGELRAAAIEAFAHSADLKEILSYFSDSDPIVREAALRSAMGVDMDEESVAEVLSATTSQIKNEVDPYVLETGLEFIIANSPEKAEIILSSIVSREDSSAACVLTVINFLAEYKDQGELIEYFISLPGASRFIDDKDFVSQLYTNS